MTVSLHPLAVDSRALHTNLLHPLDAAQSQSLVASVGGFRGVRSCLLPPCPVDCVVPWGHVVPWGQVLPFAPLPRRLRCCSVIRLECAAWGLALTYVYRRHNLPGWCARFVLSSLARSTM